MQFNQFDIIINMVTNLTDPYRGLDHRLTRIIRIKNLFKYVRRCMKRKCIKIHETLCCTFIDSQQVEGRSIDESSPHYCVYIWLKLKSELGNMWTF